MSVLPPEREPSREPARRERAQREPLTGEVLGPDGRPRPQPARRGRRRTGPVVWVAALAVAVVLLTVGTSGTRDWWAHRVGDLTGGSWPADYVIGLAVGLLPVLGVGIGMLGNRGHRRAIRMLLLGAAGFVATYLLAPSLSRYVAGDAGIKVFDQRAPGYLPGVFTGVGVWFLLLAVAFVRARRWWRHTRSRIASGPRGPA